MGASTSADMAAAAVAIRTVATGAVDESIDESGIDPEVTGIKTSFSATLNTAAKKLLRKVSSVLVRTLYTKVEFVARHMAKAPLADESEESASRSEWGFLRSR